MKARTSQEREALQQEIVDPDIYVVDIKSIGAIMCNELKLIFICLIIGLVCGALVYSTLTPVWRASATLIVGQIYDGAAPDSPIESIEPPIQVAEDLIMRNSLTKLTASMESAQKEEAAAKVALIRETLKAKVIPNTNRIDLSVSGFSPDDARRALGAIIQMVVQSHEKRYELAMKRIRDAAEKSKLDAGELGAERIRLNALLKRLEEKNSQANFGPTIVAISMLSANKAEMERLTSQRNTLEERATSRKVFATRVVDSVYVESKPYQPNLKSILSVAGVFGVLSGIMLALARQVLKQRCA